MIFAVAHHDNYECLWTASGCRVIESKSVVIQFQLDTVPVVNCNRGMVCDQFQPSSQPAAQQIVWRVTE